MMSALCNSAERTDGKTIAASYAMSLIDNSSRCIVRKADRTAGTAFNTCPAFGAVFGDIVALLRHFSAAK